MILEVLERHNVLKETSPVTVDNSYVTQL